VGNQHGRQTSLDQAGAAQSEILCKGSQESSGGIRESIRSVILKV
jgi:hypothetical protein